MIKIIADTLSCLSLEEAKDLNIGYLPQIIIFGEESFRDDIEMNSIQFLNKLRSASTMPKTAAPAPALYKPFYDEISQNNDIGIVITPSANLSGTFRGASVASKDYPDTDIRIIDTNTIGSGLGTIIKYAVELSKMGISPDSLVEKITAFSKKEKTYFLVDTLEYLHKGGRIGGASALLGSIMQVKPILSIKEGAIQAFEKQRTKIRALARLCEIVDNECPHNNNGRISIMHGDALHEAENLSQKLSELLGISSIPIYEVPPAILVHAGPGVLAVDFFMENDQ